MLGAVVILGETPLMGIYAGGNLISFDQLDSRNIVSSMLNKATAILGDFGLTSIKVITESALIRANNIPIDGFVVDEYNTSSDVISACISKQDVGILRDIKRFLTMSGEQAGRLEVIDKLRLVIPRIKEESALLSSSENITYLSVVDSQGILDMKSLEGSNIVDSAINLLGSDFANVPVYTTSDFLPDDYFPTVLTNTRQMLDNPNIDVRFKCALYMMDLACLTVGKEVDEKQPNVSVQDFMSKPSVVTPNSFNTHEDNYEDDRRRSSRNTEGKRRWFRRQRAE